jgi:hypothetical protein
MSLPTTYTAEELATWMRDELLATAAVLGMSDPTHAGYTTAVRRTLRAYGVSDLAQATDVVKLEALALIEVWRSVANQAATAINFEADGGRYDRKEIHKQALTMLAQAQAVYAELYPVAVTVEEAAPSGTADTSGGW